MNVNALLRPSVASKPALPVPVRPRWQPLRIGLVDLFHYDSEEFWFRDGHLLLRGNNGTGKSKVLSLTLPFLLDAQPSRRASNPTGMRAKRCRGICCSGDTSGGWAMPGSNSAASRKTASRNTSRSGAACRPLRRVPR